MALASKTATASSAADPALLPTGVFADKPPLPLNRPATLVGARQGCHLRLVSADISQFHAVIVRGQDGVYVHDLASRSHSFVNGAPVREHDIRDGDRIQFGRFSFAFRAGSAVFVPQQPVPAATLQLPGGKDVPIHGRAILIGQRRTADIVLNHETISNAHALIFAMSGTRYIRDLSSRTGTYVNGSLIHQQELHFGDSIRIGNAVVTYVAAAAPISVDAESDEEPHPHAARPPTPSLRSPPFGMAARAGFTRPAPATPPPPPAVTPAIAQEPGEVEPTVASPATAPESGDVELPVVSDVEPPLPMVPAVDSEIATGDEPIPLAEEPLAIARPAAPRPMPRAPIAQPQPVPEADLGPLPFDDLPIAVEPPATGELEPPAVSDFESPAVSSSGSPVPEAADEPAPIAESVSALDVEPEVPLEPVAATAPEPIVESEPSAASDFESPAVSSSGSPVPEAADEPAPIAESVSALDVEPEVQLEPVVATAPEPIVESEPPVASDFESPAVSSSESPVPEAADEPAPIAESVSALDVEPEVQLEPVVATAPEPIVEPEPPAVSDIEPPAVSDAEPLVASAVEPTETSDTETPVAASIDPPAVDRIEPAEPVDLDAAVEIPPDVESDAVRESAADLPIANFDTGADSSADAGASPISDADIAGFLADPESPGDVTPDLSPVEPLAASAFEPPAVSDVEAILTQTPPADVGAITATAPLVEEPAPLSIDQVALPIESPAVCASSTVDAAVAEPPQLLAGGDAELNGESEPLDEPTESEPAGVDFGFARRAAKSARPAEESGDPFPAIDLTRFRADAAADYHDHDWDTDHAAAPAVQPPSKPLLDLPPDLGAALRASIPPAPTAGEIEPPAPSEVEPAVFAPAPPIAESTTPSDQPAIEPSAVSEVEPPAANISTALGAGDAEPVEFLAAAEPTPESAQALARDAAVDSPAPESAVAEAATADELTDSLFGMAITNLTDAPPLVESSPAAHPPAVINVEAPVVSVSTSPSAVAAEPPTVNTVTPPTVSTLTTAGAATALPAVSPIEPPAPPRKRAFVPLAPLSLDDGFFSAPAKPAAPPPMASVAGTAAAAAAAGAGATLPGQSSGGARISTVAPPSGGSVTVGPDVVIPSPGASPPAAQAPPVVAPPVPPAAAREFDPFGDYGGIAPLHMGGMPLNLPELAPPPAYFGKISVAFDGRSITGERLPPTPLPPPKTAAPRRPATPPPVAPPAPPAPPMARAPARPVPAEEFVIGAPANDGTPSARAPIPKPPVKKKDRTKIRRPASPKGRSNTPFSDESLRIRPQDLVSGATGGIMLPTPPATPPTLTGGLGTPAADGLAVPVAERDAFSGEGPMRNNDAVFGGVPSNRRDEYVVPETDQALARHGQEHDFAEDPFWDRIDEEVPPDLLAPTAPTVAIPAAGGPTAEPVDPSLADPAAINPLSGAAPSTAAPRPAHAIDLPPAWEQPQHTSPTKPRPARRRRWPLGMLVLGMLAAAAGAAGLVYLYVPQQSTVVGVLNYSNSDAFNKVTEQNHRNFQASQLSLLAADATRAQAQGLANFHSTPDPGFLAASQKAAFVKAVQQAKWQDRDGGDESLVLTLTGTDAKNDGVRMQALLLAMWAANAQVHNNTEQLQRRIADLDKSLDSQKQTLAQLTDKLPVLQATTRTSGGDARALAAAADSRLAAWAVAAALTDSDRSDLNAARRGALALAAPATQPADAVNTPAPVASQPAMSASIASADDAIPATAPAELGAATTAPSDAAPAATQPAGIAAASDSPATTQPLDASAMSAPATAPTSQAAQSTIQGSAPDSARESVSDAQLVSLYAQLADAQRDLQQAKQTRDGQALAGIADVDAKVTAYQNELQADKAVFDEVPVLTDFAAAAAKAVDGTALLQTEILSQHQQLQENVDRMRLQQRRIAESIRLQVRKTDPDVTELNRELDVAQRLHDTARVEQIGRQIDDIQALADTEQGYNKASSDLSDACYDAARRFEAIRAMDMDAIEGQRRQFDASVPELATYALNQELAQEQLRTAAENVIIARRELVRMIPGISTDISTQSVRVADLQGQIDDRWRELEDQAWRGMDDQARLAVCRAVDGKRQQLIADAKSERDAEGDFWKTYAQWQEQSKAAHSAQIAQQQLDELQRQLDQTQAGIRTTSGERDQANKDLQQVIEPRQPDKDGRDVTVTPLDSRQWWYVGAVGAVVMCFGLAMLATGDSGRARAKPPNSDAPGSRQDGEFPDDPTAAGEPGSRPAATPRRGGRVTA